MKSIKEVINNKLASIELDKSVRTDDRIEATYNAHPNLRRIDIDIVNVRSARLISVMEGDQAPLPALNKREDDLREERANYLKANNIRPDFDKPWVSCENCMDTGFVTSYDGRKAVCMSCMMEAVKETFDESGMKDFDTYTPKGFKLDYFGNNKRKKQYDGLRNLIEGKADSSKVSLLTGGSQTGKTFLAVVSCKYAIFQGKSAQYIKADSVQYFTSEELDELKDYDYVVIDDYSSEVTLGYKSASSIHNLLEARSAKSKPTVVVTGTEKESLVANSDERISSILSRATVL
ncbi:MAG: hypothetical protein MJ094_04010 [Saccharofermentans sp.]|nr:hypothetical protein [Saccharofermentans sp.]